MINDDDDDDNHLIKANLNSGKEDGMTLAMISGINREYIHYF